MTTHPSADTPAEYAYSSAIGYPGTMGDDAIDKSASTGEGAINPGNQGLSRLTTWANGDVARAKRSISARAAFAQPTWEQPRVIQFVLDLQPAGLESGDTDPPDSIDETVQYYASGDPENGDAGFGFKIEPVGGTPTLRGVYHDGTTETVVDFDIPPEQDIPPSSGRLALHAEYWPGDDVGWYVNGRQQLSEPPPAFPSGTTGAAQDVLWSATLENQTTGEERRETEFDVRVGQFS